ncbi:MAG: hypothetical protein V1904_12155 [Bacteroidota bacterium]
MLTVFQINVYCQFSPPYKPLYTSSNLNDFTVVDECNPGGGTNCPCSINDAGILYYPGHLEVISNVNHVNTWVNAIAYKKYIDSLAGKPVFLTQVKYIYQTKLPVIPFPDTAQHQNPQAVHMMMQMYNGDSTLWTEGKQSLEGAVFWSLNPYDSSYGKFFIYTTGLQLIETGITIIPDTNWHTFLLEVDF